ncbi:hypothetical protein O3G_MSEX004441 [Manduca sexta]|uniref:TraB domain-containing protein n=1 Tax=Manduca sexta TaxID=7130 RepID=A0A921YVK0_MANSE|nr:hypothetical protein O3G_MSEX004441 [Manduca sexta]
MDAADVILKNDKIKPSVDLEEDPLLLRPHTSTVNIINECQMFIKAEDGGGDAHMNLTDNMPQESTEKPKFVTSTPDQKKDSPSDNQIADSNPECDMEEIPDLPVDEGMPSTVTVLEAPDGGKVYLIGTAHFSLQSQEDVSRVIQEVKPHVVMVELCEQRTNILLLDEEIILREAKNINIKKIRATMAQNGVFNGLMYILLLNMSAHITRELGMAPGGREPCRIVGVVGIGHVAGIVEHWGKIKQQDIPPLLKVPPPSWSTVVLRVSLRAAAAGALVWAGYKLLPRRWLP